MEHWFNQNCLLLYKSSEFLVLAAIQYPCVYMMMFSDLLYIFGLTLKCKMSKT